MIEESHLVAMTCAGNGGYEVYAQHTGRLDRKKLLDSRLLRDISTVSYQDFIGVLRFEEVKDYLLPVDGPWGNYTREWYEGLPKCIPFIMVREYEWETGLGD